MEAENNIEVELNIGILYGGLMRPPMWKGIPYNFLPALGFIEAIMFVALNPFYGIGAIPFLWLFGWMAGRFDPDVYSVITHYTQTMTQDRKACRNLGFTTYSAF